MDSQRETGRQKETENRLKQRTFLCGQSERDRKTERDREQTQTTDVFLRTVRETGRQRETENRLRLTTVVFVWTVRETGRQTETENKQTVDVSVSVDWKIGRQRNRTNK